MKIKIIEIFFILKILSFYFKVDCLSVCSSYHPNSIFSNSSCTYGYVRPYCDECGLQFVNQNVKIIGGQESIAHSWPSMVLIVIRYKFYFSLDGYYYQYSTQGYCGGTLLNRDTVVTASHCYLSEFKVTINKNIYTFNVTTNELYPTIESLYTVYLEMHDISSVFNSSIILTGKKMSIASFNRHPKFDITNHLNDIAIIKLSNYVDLNCNIQPACLPNPNISNYPTLNNISVWATGWGDFDLDGNAPHTLYNVKLTLYDGSYCKNVMPSAIKNWTYQICAGEILGGKDTCYGDSGGPLFVKDKVNGLTKYVLIGITSYGESCAKAGYAGIYTKVSPYISWIESFMNYQKINVNNSLLISNNNNILINNTTVNGTLQNKKFNKNIFVFILILNYLILLNKF